MRNTFHGAAAFNSKLAWDTSSVTNMEGTFYGAKAFNQPLAWDLSQVTSNILSLSGSSYARRGY